MKAGVAERLERLAERHEEVARLLASPEVLEDPARLGALAREHAELAPVMEAWHAHEALRASAAEAEAMLADEDPEMRALAESELEATRERLREVETRLEQLLVPGDPEDESNLFLEIRAGTGGEEAALFAAQLLRMYLRYAERHGWGASIVSESPSEQGGYREVVVRIEGRGAYGRLKLESGGHRVQRVPVTESQGRIHTSACTVAVLPEVADIEDVEIGPQDLRIDTYRASGAGGQHVNKTDSAIRITHLPTGIVVECQDERSQHKNRARAMALLRARLLARERERQSSERALERKLLVGSGDRSERIRTYNFPQNRVTDHRINLTLHKLDAVLDGELDLLVDPLLRELHAEQLTAGETA